MLTLPSPLLLLLWPVLVVLAQSSSSPSSVASSSSSLSSSGNATASSTSSSAAPSNTTFPSLGGYSPCVVTCLETAISQVGCTSVVDVDCYCHNATRFVRDIRTCIDPQCPDDLASAENVTQLFCNVASPNVSLSYPPLPSTSSSAPLSSTTSDSFSSQSSAASSNSDSTSSPTPTNGGQSSDATLNPPVTAASVTLMCLLAAFAVVMGA
ncbi:hypothetical protein BDW22DRAFT_1355879 [Trametopsis cervina]|nr:hypothetical protein BDW22DRAFT_1355879 [Trametopsis cervina]